MLTPLHGAWVIAGDALPERLRAGDAPEPMFRLPGADALAAFADLIGGDTPQTPDTDGQTGAPFPLPALLPEDAPGEVTLAREVDFGGLCGDGAWLAFDMLSGQGSVTVNSLPPRFLRPGAPGAEAITLSCPFDNAPVTLDVTPALRARRRFRITLRFSAQRPAGVCGPVMLRTAACAYLGRIDIAPEASSLSLSAEVTAFSAGDYSLRADLCPAEPAASPGEAAPAREISVHLSAGETRTVHLAMEAHLPSFSPGSPFAAPGVKLGLYASSSGRRALCDSAVLMCGLPGPAPAYHLPLDADDLRRPPEQLLAALIALHVPGVRLPAAAPDTLYRLLTRAGISAVHGADIPPETRAHLLRYPCAVFERSLSAPRAEDPVLSAWQLCGLVTYPRAADAGLLPAELLREAAGRALDPAQPDTQAVLAWLRAFSIRLRAEAMRQGKLTGALCAPGEARQPDVAQAIQTALSPLHLSALPLCGAWWTGAHFSASLRAFLPKDVLSADRALRAVATLEDAQGYALAQAEFPCAPWRSNAGLLEATLPDAPCVFELVTRLDADNDVLEESTMPVYVGERGALEAAF